MFYLPHVGRNEHTHAMELLLLSLDLVGVCLLVVDGTEGLEKRLLHAARLEDARCDEHEQRVELGHGVLYGRAGQQDLIGA